ncbi:DUF1064 domain-containing protein [Thalassobacillus sp. C254]|uniref:DUF1064 domain-containing protein n=1 Tax=Thalassobacillus sp. C254 TaxID=1225341 RepID=UPI0006D1BD99|nr:DUF1064 domain-containing protein [Thalassobacillus sp. C254]
MKASEYRKSLKKKKNKYRAKRTVVDGHTFDSKLEARYYQQLLWLKAHGEIKEFTLQPRYILQEAFKKDSTTYQKIEYVADFEVLHEDGSIETVDVKGVETTDFRIKKKLFHKRYTNKLSVITFDQRFGGWIELDKLKKYKQESSKGG